MVLENHMSALAPLLNVKSITKTFAGVVAAEDVSVKIAEGEVVAVIGANGAGKTTFINMVTGWIRPSSGEVWFDGRNITGFAPRNLASTGLSRTFQVSQLFTSLTVRENLMIALAVARHSRAPVYADFSNAEREARAEQIAETFNLREDLDRACGVLSQGTKKLLDISLASAQDPRFLMLDEPTSGVSAEEKFKIMDLVISTLRKLNTTVIFVEHDMDVVKGFADRVIAFANGRIIADGPSVEVMNDEEVKRNVGHHARLGN